LPSQWHVIAAGICDSSKKAKNRIGVTASLLRG
jgi:hypothetical protein